MRFELTKYLNPNSTVQDTAINAETYFWDSGFTTKIKDIIPYFAAVRKNTAFALSTYIDNYNRKMTAEEEYDMAIYLAIKAAAFPESEYYATKALGQRWLGVVISVLILITFGLAFNATQSFVISTSFEASFNLPTWVSGIALSIVFGITIFGGVRGIVKMSEVIVPIMALGYLLIALVVIALNINEIPSLITMIVTEAFNPSSAIGGGIGAVILQGAKRGMFSNEAGLGSAPNVAAVAYVAHPVQQGIVQSFSVFIDTIILCSCTAFIILLSGVYTPGAEGVQGVLLTQNALIEHIGPFGGYFITIALFLFGFSSMIYNYYLAENSLNFFVKGNVTIFNIFRISCILLVVWGSFQDLSSIFAFADLTMGLLAIINMIVITLLYKPVLQLIRGYERQIKEGKTPVLRYNDYVEFNFDKETWKEIVDNINDKKIKD